MMSPWPLPKLYYHGSSIVSISHNVELEHTVTVTGKISPFWPDEGYSHRTLPWPVKSCKLRDSSVTTLRSAFQRFKTSLISENFVPSKFFPRGFDFEPPLNGPKALVSCIKIEEYRIKDHEELKEVYSLELSEEGHVLIKVLSYLGGIHALNSLAQLFYTHSKDASFVYCPLAPVRITDRPIFAHRGFNLDICRNRISPHDVKRTIDGMSFVKLNVLHLHATDSQSWPIEIPALPDLAAKGAYHDSQIWSTEDLEAVQQHGAERGVEVYIEIDMPGHTGSIAHAYPHLITGYDQRPWERWAAEPPSGQLKLNSLPVRKFVTALLNDLLPRSSGVSPFFHIGGDEFNRKVYELDENVKSSSKDIIRPLLQEFVDHATSLLSNHSITPITWEELLLDWDLRLPASTVVQIWRSQASAAKIASKGYRIIVGACTHWYLDAGYGMWVDPDPKNPDSPVKSPFLDWNGPYKSWRQIYSYNPLEGIKEEDIHLVLGGEAHLWGELTDSVNLDNMIWPRLAAASEILWKDKSKVTEEVTRRLAELRERMVCRGFMAAMVQMEWCLANPGGGQL